MDHKLFAYFSHTHYWYEVGMESTGGIYISVRSPGTTILGLPSVIDTVIRLAAAVIIVYGENKWFEAFLFLSRAHE